MKKASIITYGCQMNVNESAKIKKIFQNLGYDVTEETDDADAVFLNTCTVREGAATQIFGKLGELKALKEKKGTIIGVTGCFAQEQGEELVRKFPIIDIVMGNQNIGRIPQAIEKIENNESTHEVYTDNEDEILGVNSKVQLAQAEKILRNRKNIELMDSGVILIDPDATYIEDNVQIGQDTVIYPNVTIQGNTKIGKNCEILGNTRIENSVIADNVRIEASVVEKSTLEEGVTVGPFAHLRPKAYLKETVHVGNFVEIKNSTLEKGVKTGHLTYIGDAEIGQDTNVGAGTITCNYDGKNKHRTKIGKNAFIGSNSIIVAPVEIGSEVLTAAGSVITEDIPDEALAFGRAKQVNKEKKNK